MTETIEWIDADGISTELEVEWDVKGRFAPRVVFDEEKVPGRPGMRFKAARHEVREIVMLVDMVADTEAALRTAVRDMVARMDPLRGPGTLRVTSPVGDQREIRCFYAAGLELDEKPGNSGPTLQSAPVMFRAHDPYWYDVSPQTSTYQMSDPVPFFPIFPLRLSSSTVAVQLTVTNTGDVESWPVWTVVGPGTGIGMTNLSTGLSLSFPALTLTAGESLIIDTRPGIKTIAMQDGANAFPLMDTASTIWPLQKGANLVNLAMTGTTVGVSSLQLRFWRGYLSP